MYHGASHVISWHQIRIPESSSSMSDSIITSTRHDSLPLNVNLEVRPDFTTHTSIMDSSLSRVSTDLINKLSDKDKQELQQFIMQESQKATIQNCTSIAYIQQSEIPWPKFPLTFIASAKEA